VNARTLSKSEKEGLGYPRPQFEDKSGYRLMAADPSPLMRMQNGNTEIDLLVNLADVNRIFSVTG
jgi:hypothetical protein